MLQLNNEEQRFLHKSLAVLLGVATVGGAGYLGWKQYQKYRADKEAEKGLSASSPASFAKRIRIAIEGPGTNEKMLRESVAEMPSESFWKDVVKSYRTQYGSNLITDLEGDLGAGEYLEIMQIISGLDVPAGQVNKEILTTWARRLQIAFDYTYWGIPGTDNDAVFKVFKEVPSKSAFLKLEQTYNQITGGKLMDDLKSELNASEQQTVRQIYHSKS